MELIIAVVAVAATIAGVYWYVHKKNPDLAQDVTDTIVEGVKEDTIDKVKND